MIRRILEKLKLIKTNNVWSVFESCKIKDNVWITELNFYYGDLSNINLETDLRFKEVKNKRKQAKFLGTCKTTFPIKYQLTLSNGKIIKFEDYEKI